MKITVTNTWQQLPYTQGTIYIPRGVVCLATGTTAPDAGDSGIVITETVKAFHSTGNVWIRNGNDGTVEVQVENFI